MIAPKSESLFPISDATNIISADINIFAILNIIKIMELNNIYLGFALATFAGLSTGIGSGIALFTRSFNKRFLAIALGLSAGIMIYVSFVEFSDWLIANIERDDNSLAIYMGKEI